MAAMAKFVASFPPNHTDGIGEPDPHADYRVNPYSYLAIDGVITGEYKYIISMKPKEIPKGFHITQHQKLPGLRKFKVVKDGADTYDIVYVGTMMVQNGFAYIAGQKGPYDYLTQVWFPPFAVSYPLEHPAGMTNRDVVAKVMEDHRPKLIESIIKANGNDTTKDGILDFDLTKGHVLYPPHPTCTICPAKLLVYENSRCPVCDDEGHNSKEDCEKVEQMKSGYEDEIAELRSKLILKGARMAEQQEAVQEMKAEIKKMETRLNEKETELVGARAEAREALMKAAGVTEQLEAAQAAHAVMEAELQEIASVGRMFSAHTTDLDDDILKKRRRMSEGEDAEKVLCAVEEATEIGERIDAKPS
ncbi:hypothetical protein OROHE_000754 [Orobanche hederae]